MYLQVLPGIAYEQEGEEGEDEAAPEEDGDEGDGAFGVVDVGGGGGDSEFVCQIVGGRGVAFAGVGVVGRHGEERWKDSCVYKGVLDSSEARPK